VSALLSSFGIVFRSIFHLLLLALLFSMTLTAQAGPAFEDNMAQRTLACVACHGKEGRAGPDGYYPRLAGKPAVYLYNQLLNFRDGRRHYGLMTGLVQPLSDDYLMEIAQYFSALSLPYPAPKATNASRETLALGRSLVMQGDPARKLPACVQCHGQAMTGVLPHVPGLLGLSTDYLNAQLGGWKTGQRRAHAPDCMAPIAKQLSNQEVTAVSRWLAAQPLPTQTQPQAKASPWPVGTQAINCGSAPSIVKASLPATLPPPKSNPVAQGAYIARAGNCMGCHTAPGGDSFAGGRAIPTPFGTVFSSNLTPDAQTCLGRWSSNDFWQALHHGRSKDGRLLNPAFPYVNFTKVSRADSDALFAYLQTQAPSAQPNKAHAMRWPFGTQAALGAWRALYFTPGEFKVEATQSGEWNRGAYLVQGLGHCAACHTPRDSLGGLKNSASLSGGMVSMQNWFAPSLRSVHEAGTSEALGQDMQALLKTGIHPGGSATGPMAEVVKGSTQYLSDADLRAMVVYLKSLTPPTPQNPPPVKRIEDRKPGNLQGTKLYEAHCIQCHGAQGEGVRGAYPPLAQNRAVTLNNPANLVQIVLHGGYAPSTAGNPRPYGMPPYVLQMNDRETASVLNYIRNAWGNQAPEVTELDVNQAR
jgi:cytochrome c553